MTFRRFRDEGADFPRFSTFPALSGGVLISGNAPTGTRIPREVPPQVNEINDLWPWRRREDVSRRECYRL